MTLDQLNKNIEQHAYLGLRHEQPAKKEQFKSDLLASLGIQAHPKAQHLFDLAWDHNQCGYRQDFREITSLCLDFAKLL